MMPGKVKHQSIGSLSSQPKDGEQARRAAFTNEVIQAIKQLELSQAEPKPDILAARALDKLQYDLPLLTVKEVDALSDVLRSSCTSTKGANLPQGITRQLISNVTSAVLASAKPAAARPQAAVTEPEPALPSASMSLLEVAHTSHTTLAAAYQRLSAVLLLQLTNTTLALPTQDAWHMLHTYDIPDTSTEQHSATPGQDAPSQLPGMSQMQAGAGDTSATSAAPALPELTTPTTYIDVEASELDDDDVAYEPLELLTTSQPPPSSSKQQQQRGGAPHSAPTTTTTPSWRQSSTGWHNPLSSNGQSSALLGPNLNGTSDCPDAGQCWSEVRARLLHMCSPAHLAALTVPRLQPGNTTPQPTATSGSNGGGGTGGGRKDASTVNGVNSSISRVGGGMVLGKPGAQVQLPAVDAQQQQDSMSVDGQHLWQDVEVQQGLLQVLRSLGVHPHAAELQPVLQGYIMVVLDWLEQHTRSVESLLQQVWEALGAQQIAGLPRQQPSRAKRSAAGGPAAAAAAAEGPVLLAEADLVLNMVLHLSKKLSCEAAGRAALWRQVHSQLLPVLHRCLADVAAAGQQHTHAAAALDKTAAVVLVYLDQRPGGFNIAQHLQSSGILRGLCALFPAWATHPEAETLRQAVLLCAATSPELLTWVMAVPGVKTLVTCSPDFSKGGAAYAHGVVWRLLIAAQGRTTATTTSAGPGVSSQQKVVAGVSAESASVELQEILDQGVTSCHQDQVGCMHECLQLMSRVWRVCDGRVTWGAPVQASMRRALSGLKQQTSTTTTTTTTTSTTPAPHASQDDDPFINGRCSIEGDGVVVAELGAGPESVDDDKHGSGGAGGSLVQFGVLQVRHWKSCAAAALKEMLTEGGKKD